MKKVDARGLSCPQPVVMLKKAMADGGNSYQCLTDSMVCVENCTRFAENQGFKVSLTRQGDEFLLNISK